MKTSETIGEIVKALLGVQSEIGNAAKDKKNPHFGSTYASLAAVLDVAKPVLIKHGVLAIQSPFNADNGNIGLTTRLLHESGEWVESSIAVASKGDAQGAGSVISYLRRYSLASMLNFCQEDDDGNHASGRAQDAGNGQQKAAPPPANGNQATACQAVPPPAAQGKPAPPAQSALEVALAAGRSAPDIDQLTKAYHAAVKCGASAEQLKMFTTRKAALLTPDVGFDNDGQSPCKSCGSVVWKDRDAVSCSECFPK